MRMLKSMAPLACGLVAVMLGRAPAQQDYLAETETVNVSTATLNNLYERLEALEAKDEQQAEDEWKDVSGEGWTFKLGGRIHWDYVNFAHQDGGSEARFGDIQDYWEFRRIRLTVEGEGYGVYEFKWDLEFEPEGSTANDDSGVLLRDLYVGIQHLPCVNHVRFGYFKEPFSLEQAISSNHITFIERSICDQAFVGARALGLGNYNWTQDESLIWQTGVFFGKEDFEDEHEFVSDNQGLELVGRVVATPYYCESGRYYAAFGVGDRYVDDANDSVRFRSRPETHEGPRFIDSGAIVADGFNVANVESVITLGPLSLQGEAFYATVNDAAVFDELEYWGGYVFVSYFLTGEHRPYNRRYGYCDRPKPFTNFWLVPTADGCCAGLGAWEAVARLSYLDLSGTDFKESGVAPQGAGSGEQTDVTVGMNWYLTSHIKLMFNYIHAWNDYDIAPLEAECDILEASVRWNF